MKNVTITEFSFAEVDAPKETFGYLKIPVGHKKIRAEGENLEVSDGYHTFDELYEHRITLFITLCRYVKWMRDARVKLPRVWRSKVHYDDTRYKGWFILGIGEKKKEQITYHLPISKWKETDFLKYTDTLKKAPKWDGHSSADVLERLKAL